MVCLLPLVIVTTVFGHASTPPPAHDPLLLPATPSDQTVLLQSPTRRVRARDERAARLLAEGMRRSRTFASLMAALQRTDVIVYVETVPRLPDKLGGRILLQAVTPEERYLRVQVLETLRPNAAIEVVAHELRHALEIAEEPSVVDDAGLAALYQRIGYRSFGPHGYDTNAARMTSHIVRRELGG